MKADPTAYYALVAQVLPVLALVLLFEVRMLGDWREWWKHGDPDKADISVLAACVGVFYPLLFMFAETAALSAVEAGKPSTYAQVIVHFAMTLYLFMVIFFPTQPYAEALLDRVPPLRRMRLRSYEAQRKRREAREGGTPSPTSKPTENGPEGPRAGQ